MGKLTKLLVFSHARSQFPDVHNAYIKKSISYGALSRIVHEDIKKRYHLHKHHTTKRVHRKKWLDLWG
jgi:hypothetical protein